MKSLILTILSRFKEPSSWAAITTALVGAYPALEGVGGSLTLLGAGVAGALAFFLREKGGNDN